VYYVTDYRKEEKLHTHFSTVAAMQAFLAVVIIGTLWRLLSAHAASSTNPLLSKMGRTMAFQY
jgi:hypothetical protein